VARILTGSTCYSAYRETARMIETKISIIRLNEKS
jgi:hypothetical protein